MASLVASLCRQSVHLGPVDLRLLHTRTLLHLWILRRRASTRWSTVQPWTTGLLSGHQPLLLDKLLLIVLYRIWLRAVGHAAILLEVLVVCHLRARRYAR